MRVIKNKWVSQWQGKNAEADRLLGTTRDVECERGAYGAWCMM
jgi:hypothetical protein